MTRVQMNVSASGSINQSQLHPPFGASVYVDSSLSMSKTRVDNSILRRRASACFRASTSRAPTRRVRTRTRVGKEDKEFCRRKAPNVPEDADDRNRGPGRAKSRKRGTG